MSFQRNVDAQLIQQFFRKYYRENFGNLYVPFEFEKRELGYTRFGQKMMVRHLSFRNFEEFRGLLVKEAPLHVYRSAAIYQYPQAPMEEKGWLGAELIFDIDADHLETECKQDHDYQICPTCKEKVDEKTSSCPSCGKEVLEVRMVCDECLGETKKQMQRLIDFIEKDFGLNNLTLSFSGNRGYHLSVSSKEVLELDRTARQEIVEYVTGSHLDLRLQGLYGEPTFMPDYEDPGWRGRIARETRKIFEKLADDDEKIHRKLEKSIGPRIIKQYKLNAFYWSAKPRWDLIQTKSHLEIFASLAVEYASSHIDTVVTTDVHRLLRYAETLNGKTGLKAAVVRLDEFETFDPLEDAVVIPEEPQVSVKVAHCPQFLLKGEVFGPYENEVVKLPAYAGVYLMCKGLATLAND